MARDECEVLTRYQARECFTVRASKARENRDRRPEETIGQGLSCVFGVQLAAAQYESPQNPHLMLESVRVNLDQ